MTKYQQEIINLFYNTKIFFGYAYKAKMDSELLICTIIFIQYL